MGIGTKLKSLLLGDGGGKFAEKIGSMYEKIQQNRIGKRELALEAEKLAHEIQLEAIDFAEKEMGAKRDVMVAELQHGDEYTKRTRPKIVRTLTYNMIAMTYALIVIKVLEGTLDNFTFEMPKEAIGWMFTGWIGLTATWKIGRSAQHVWPGNRFSQLANGTDDS